MDKADTLIAAYVEAGYSKIHLDCSMSCADDPDVLDDETVAQRTARLMRIAEDAAHSTSLDCPCTSSAPRCPSPAAPTRPSTSSPPPPPTAPAAPSTPTARAFADLGLDNVWPRVVALVVQPGVEFDHLHVIDYQRDATADLRRVLDDEDHLVFEAHSTDYQRPAQLRELVEDHWAVLKVGPALTFAMREALFALAHIEDELLPRPARSNLIEVVERRMLAEPDYWRGYYDGDPLTQRRPAATATATGCATTGPTTRSTPHA